MSDAPRDPAASKSSLAWQAGGFVALLSLAQLAVALFSRFRILRYDPHPDFGSLPYLLRDDALVIAIFLVGAFVAVFACSLVSTRAGSTRARKAVRVFFAILATLHCLALATNVIAVRNLGRPLSVQWFHYAEIFRSTVSLDALSGIVNASVVLVTLAMVAVPVVALAARRAVSHLAARRRRTGQGSRPDRMLDRVLCGCAALLLPALIALPANRQSDGTARRSVADILTFNKDYTGNPVHVLVASALFDAERQLRAIPFDERLTANYRIQGPVAAMPLVGAKPDIVVIVVESLSAEAFADEAQQLPQMSALRREGTYYANATVDYPFSNRTFFSYLFSRHPRMRIDAEMSTLEGRDDRLAQLTDVMRRGGYATALYSSQDFRYENARPFLDGYRFGKLEDITTIRCGNVGGPQYAGDPQDDVALDDGCVFDQALGWMKRQTAPTLLLLWTGATHYPYWPAHGDYPQARDRYLAALRDTDARIGALVDRLRAMHRGRPLLLVVTGDHGESFGRHGVFAHPNSVFDEEVHVPFLAVGDRFAPGGISRRLVDATDLAPTLADAAGIAHPAGWQGHSLLRPDPPGNTQRFMMALSNNPAIGMRTARAKYLLDLRSARMVRYDLASDPLEMKPLPVTAAEREAVMRRMATWQRYNESAFEPAHGPAAAP